MYHPLELGELENCLWGRGGGVVGCDRWDLFLFACYARRVTEAILHSLIFYVVLQRDTGRHDPRNVRRACRCRPQHFAAPSCWCISVSYGSFTLVNVTGDVVLNGFQTHSCIRLIYTKNSSFFLFYIRFL